MRKIARIFSLLTFFIFGISHNSYSQYLQTLKENIKWYNYYGFESTVNFNFQVSGDTIFMGKTYKKLIGQNTMLLQIPNLIFVREDTINKSIYIINDSIETLLYDYNLKVVDTFNKYNMVLDSITDTLYNVLLSQVMEFSITPKKVFYFHSLKPPKGGHIIWVEGIGSLSGILWPNGNVAGSTLLLCHYNEKGIRDYHFQPYYDSPPCEGPVMGIKEFEKTYYVDIYPNPIIDIINIKLIEPLTGKLDIINNLGQIVKENIFNEEQFFQLNLSNLLPGIYFMKFIINNDVYFEKIIKNN